MMPGFNEERIVPALVLLATAMYLIAVAPGFRRRRSLRIAAIAVYAFAFAVAAGLVLLWLAGIDIER
jgi:multisubunit Na+/H+ antiporter MnhB subunit